ncbi:hypothetical protein TNCV_1374211 [Trichonephila clavipes]|nr:hypothetical protein TNCV_1374211 [Trichonephila clavipes]
MNSMDHIIQMPDDNVVKKITAIQNHWNSEAWKTKAEMVRLSGIRLCDYKRENLENKRSPNGLISGEDKMRSIDRPSISCSWYGDGLDLCHAGLLSLRTNGVETRRGVQSAGPLHSPIRDDWRRERDPRGLKGSARKLTMIPSIFCIIFHFSFPLPIFFEDTR